MITKTKTFSTVETKNGDTKVWIGKENIGLDLIITFSFDITEFEEFYNQFTKLNIIKIIEIGRYKENGMSYAIVQLLEKKTKLKLTDKILFLIENYGPYSTNHL